MNLASFAAACAVVVTSAAARADPAPGFYAVEWTYDTAPSQANTFAARESGRSWWVRLGTPIAPLETILWTTAHDAESNRLVMRFAGPSCGRVALSLGATPLLSEIARTDTSGSNGPSARPGPPGCLFFASLGSAQARAVVSLLHVAERDVSTLGVEVTATFAVSQPRPGSTDVSIDIVLAAPSSSPLIAWFTTPTMDSPFTLEVTRDGRPVATRNALMGGSGAAGYVVMGAQARDETPLSERWDVSRRGHYAVRCRYDARFDVPSSAFGTPSGAGITRTFTGRVEFDVR